MSFTRNLKIGFKVRNLKSGPSVAVSRSENLAGHDMRAPVPGVYTILYKSPWVHIILCNNPWVHTIYRDLSRYFMLFIVIYHDMS